MRKGESVLAGTGEVRRLEELRVASIRQDMPIHELSEVINRLVRFVKEKGIGAGKPMAIYYDKEFNPERADIEVCVPVTNPFPNEGDIRCRILPAGKYLVITHEGAYDTIKAGYERLLHYAQEEGYRIIGPPREVYIVGPGSQETPSAWKTEIYFPVLG